MIKQSLIVLIFVLAYAGHVSAQDEFITWQDKCVTDFELKILRVNSDTLFYKAFFKKRFYLTADLVGYKYKDSVWVYFSDTVPDKIKPGNIRFDEKGRQAELFLIEDGLTQTKNILLINISNDTLYYEGFLKHKFYLLKDLIAYRYKSGKWNYVSHGYRENIRAQKDTASMEYKKRKGVLLAHAITNKRMYQLNSVNNYAVYFHSDDLGSNSWYLKKDRYIALRLKADTLGTLFVLPLVKICKDTLYFDKNYFDWNSYFSIAMQDLSYICFDVKFPSSQIPFDKRIKLESELTLLQMAYNSSVGFWLNSEEKRKKVIFTSVDIGY